ncbi:MAG: hypothetical protein FWG24_04725 [Eggerthellaceae bacterium]|nr:hypothetical protein [Eggerthellaceae bacterium]
MLKLQEQISFVELERSAWSKTAAQKRAKEQGARAKKRLSVMKLVVLPLVILVGLTTLAYLSALTNTEVNVLGIGKTSVEIDERFNGWDTKQVQLTLGTGDDYVPSVARAMIVPYIMDKEGNYIACDLDDFSLPVNNKMDLGDVILEFASDWADNWIYGEDGYFYYRHVLFPTTAANANKTSVLLTKVSLSDAALEKYGDEAFVKIEVLADVLQAEGNGPGEWGLVADMSTRSVTQA